MKEHTNKFKRPELLAPAGNLEKMKIALQFGADAVYFGLPDFSLRMRINQFGVKEIKEAAEYCRKEKKKFYVTLNIYAHERHLKALPKHLKLVKEIKPDGVIVSDVGILNIIRKKLPSQEIHLSTQANATNSEAVRFWGQQGIARVILAREVTLKEIVAMKKEVPEVELEYFVHGAMCMSYSGRCILSKWMTNRSANLGDCSQPCRWQYHLKNQKSKIKNQKNDPKQAMSNGTEGDSVLTMSMMDDKDRFQVDLEEDQHGTYFFNSYDLCLIEHLSELMDAGIDSLKIEGRAKSVYYVAMVVRAYRLTIDAVWKFKKKQISKSDLEEIICEQKMQLEKLSHRGYSTGFLLGKEPNHLFNKAYENTDWLFVGISQEEKDSKTRGIFVHNHLKKGDEVEIVGVEETSFVRVENIVDEQGDEIESAHGGLNKVFNVTLSENVKGVFLARRRD